MPQLIYQTRPPSSADFQHALAEAMANTNPIDDLLHLGNELWGFEAKYHLSSADFYEQYQRGLLNDELQHCTEWVITYDLFINSTRHTKLR